MLRTSSWSCKLIIMMEIRSETLRLTLLEKGRITNLPLSWFNILLRDMILLPISIRVEKMAISITKLLTWATMKKKRHRMCRGCLIGYGGNGWQRIKPGSWRSITGVRSTVSEKVLISSWKLEFLLLLKLSNTKVLSQARLKDSNLRCSNI